MFDKEVFGGGGSGDGNARVGWSGRRQGCDAVFREKGDVGHLDTHEACRLVKHRRWRASQG